ncbi:MAG TPA: sigma-54-dependent Fis family transcriptional regulator [Candidatus Marinimicrobia bacterium]|nr:sigma-54-dependent Fis family transcriptional regulator [Candidatus Neomarinimicrobiota bacterium]
MSKHRILIVDDDASIRSVLREALSGNYQITLAKDGFEALAILEKEPIELVITDLMMPGMTGLEMMQKVKQSQPGLGFLVITAYGTIETAVNALKQGAFDFITKPFSISQLESRINRCFEIENLIEENRELKRQLKTGMSTKSLIGNSPAMERLWQQIMIVAKSDAPVLIEGESGTGKELVAQAIHDNSSRDKQAFLKINCSAIPETLFESTLFGHEKGAYTSATKMNKGFFEEAHLGTFLLDEITEMPLAMQAKLLRVLQEGKIMRVGSSQEISVDVRIIATTNRNLKKMVEENGFRQDLFYRLNVFPITVSALRDRIEDIPVLAVHFLERFKSKYGYERKEFNHDVIEFLSAQKWEGNVRQLENAVERAILYSQDAEILTLEHFSACHQPHTAAPKTNSNSQNESIPLTTIAEMEKNMIYRALEETANNRTKAADILGISVRTLRNKLNEYAKK